jgi:hypothetical protein
MDNQSLPSIVDYILCALAFAVVALVIVFARPSPMTKSALMERTSSPSEWASWGE